MCQKKVFQDGSYRAVLSRTLVVGSMIVNFLPDKTQVLLIFRGSSSVRVIIIMSEYRNKNVIKYEARYPKPVREIFVSFISPWHRQASGAAQLRGKTMASREVLSEATSIHEGPVPAYLLDQIARMIDIILCRHVRNSPKMMVDIGQVSMRDGSGEKIADFLLARMNKSNINIRLKAMQIINVSEEIWISFSLSLEVLGAEVYMMIWSSDSIA
jgi:hypothetical protein